MIMKIAVSGSSGLVGSALVEELARGENVVTRIVRRKSGAPREVGWEPRPGGSVESAGLEGLDAVVHLAGENIASGRWTPAVKDRIRSSRVDGTRVLSTALAGLKSRPRALICASAIGFYGHRPEEILTEVSSAGTGFLAELCREWEAAADPARAAGIRVAHLRFGVVLSTKGGALAEMLLPFRFGLGGVIGDGAQYMSWLHIDDAVQIILHAATNEKLAGAVNAVSPHPITNRAYTHALGAVLGRPTIFPMPAFAARLAFGEMADELLLSSSRVSPAKLSDHRFGFRHAEIEPALRHLLK